MISNTELLKIKKQLTNLLYGATTDLKRTDGAFDKGLYGAGEFGYSVNASETKDLTFKAANATPTTGTYNSSSATLLGVLGGDTEFTVSKTGEFGGTSGATSVVRTIAFLSSDLTNVDLDKKQLELSQ